MVPNAKHASLDLHLGPTFIELAKVHDGIAQRRDEVDAVEDSIVAGPEHNGANALYVHLGHVAEPH